VAKKLLICLLALMLAVALVGCDEVADDSAYEPVVQDAPEDAATEDDSADSDGTTFEDGVLTTDRMIIEITDYRVIQPGDDGNAFGDGPVIAFWYSVTNLTDDSMDPTTAWIMTMTAIQDNDPNMTRELSVGLHPDSDLVGNQMADIKEGGTIENAVAYELDDETTPIELVASENLGITSIGSMTFSLD